ncbi:MAG: DUF1345 domain-containing protein [Pseudomonadota bacterium]
MHKHKTIFLQLYARPRLVASVIIGFCSLLMIRFCFTSIDKSTGSLIAWNIGTWLYLIWAWTTMLKSTVDHMKYNALKQDDGEEVVLALTLIAATASIASILLELAAIKHYPATQQPWHLGLAALTIICSWFLVHTSFALHYAHEYYDPKANLDCPCIDFPGCTHPVYFDFLYFSFIIGMACQTADIAIKSKKMRKLGFLHGVISFFFNTILIAITINIAASLTS